MGIKTIRRSKSWERPSPSDLSEKLEENGTIMFLTNRPQAILLANGVTQCDEDVSLLYDETILSWMDISVCPCQ